MSHRHGTDRQTDRRTHPKQHLGRFSWFCGTHGCVQQTDRHTNRHTDTQRETHRQTDHGTGRICDRCSLSLSLFRDLSDDLCPLCMRCGPITTTLLLLLLLPLNGLFSRTIWVSWYQKGKTSLHLNEARDDGLFGWQWHQLDHMQTICTSLQTDNHSNTSSLNFLQARCSSW